MMTLRYSQEEITQTYPDCSTLAQLFRAVEKDAEQTGKVVCQFRINGVNFTEADEKRLEPLGLGEVEVVEVLVDSPDNLLRSVIMNWIEELPRMVQQSDSISASLRDDGFQVHYTPLVRLIDSCQFLIESLTSIKTFNVVQGFIAADQWVNSEQAMNKAVTETVEAFEKRDSNWVADVIEYDLANSLERWHQVLRDLHGHLTSTGHFPALSPALHPKGT